MHYSVSLKGFQLSLSLSMALSPKPICSFWGFKSLKASHKYKRVSFLDAVVVANFTQTGGNRVFVKDYFQLWIDTQMVW